MAKNYQTRPSSLLKVEDDYLAYMIDEFSIFIESELTDDKGRVHWNKVKFDTTNKHKRKPKNNDSFKEFLIKHSK